MDDAVHRGLGGGVTPVDTKGEKVMQVAQGGGNAVSIFVGPCVQLLEILLEWRSCSWELFAVPCIVYGLTLPYES